jgi:hypothetical protein
MSSSASGMYLVTRASFTSNTASFFSFGMWKIRYRPAPPSTTSVNASGSRFTTRSFGQRGRGDGDRVRVGWRDDRARRAPPVATPPAGAPSRTVTRPSARATSLPDTVATTVTVIGSAARSTGAIVSCVAFDRSKASFCPPTSNSVGPSPVTAPPRFVFPSASRTFAFGFSSILRTALNRIP